MSNKKKPLNIALIDLNHMTFGIHTNTVPLGIGLIAYYLQKTVKHTFDIRIFKNPAVFLDTLKGWRPDVLGMAQYLWNSELNMYMAQLLKKSNPNCFIIAGGPNLYLSSEERRKYLQEKRSVDLCVSYDGEIPFAETIKRFAAGESIEDIKSSPGPGTYTISPINGALVESRESAPRIKSLDVFGSIYAEGFFDKFLDEGYWPFVQTQRGCPFKCAYCHTSDDYYSHVIFQSPDCFRRDIEYLGQRFSGQHNVILEIANTNFGLFDEDLKIARIIREIQDKYDWPKMFIVNSGKDPDKLLKLLSILKYKFNPSIALQTLTPGVLKNIKRSNVGLKKFVSFQKKVSGIIDRNTATELILSLPEETKESFLDTISLVLNSRVQRIEIYTLMVLKGTPLADSHLAAKYKHDLRFRVVPRCFSQINGVKIIEPEEVVVGTKTMSFQDYLSLRGLALIIAIFSSSGEMLPIRKFLGEYNFDIAQWIFGIHDDISKFPDLRTVYNSFLKETENELFDSQESLREFFSKQENYDLLVQGKLGDNLLRKYKTIALSKYYRQCLRAASYQLRRLIQRRFDLKQFDLFVNDLESYLASRDIGHIFKDGCNQIKPYNATLYYDIPKWLACKESCLPLENYRGEFSYSVVMTDYACNRLRTFWQMNSDPELSLQMLYRDCYSNDFWPEWIYSGTTK